MKRKNQHQIAYFQGMVDFWRLHLPPGWTIRGYSCDEFDEMIRQLEEIQAEMDNIMGRISRAEADFDATLSHAKKKPEGDSASVAAPLTSSGRRGR